MTTRFHLDRREDATGVSGTGRIAEGVRFSDGTVALRWVTSTRSTGLYDDMATMIAIHGHGGKTEVKWDDPLPEPFNWGRTNCLLDSCENSPFGSAGGLANRSPLVAPQYVPEDQRAEYLDGYAFAAAAMYGADWRTCSFGWAPAMAIVSGEPAAAAS